MILEINLRTQEWRNNAVGVWPGYEVSPGAASDPHKFTGKELDDETGLYYFNARYYDAHLGRFISVDPVGGSNTDPQSWNRYAYALNNPVTVTDPSGQCAEDLCIGEAAAVAALVSATIAELNSPDPNNPSRTKGEALAESAAQKAQAAADATAKAISDTGKIIGAVFSKGSSETEGSEETGQKRPPKEGAGRNEQHGKSEDKPSQVEQKKDLERQLQNATGRREKKKLRNKMRHVQEDMDKRRTGTQHSQRDKGIGSK